MDAEQNSGAQDISSATDNYLNGLDTNQEQSTPALSPQAEQAKVELDKLDKFMYKGQEWTPKKLEQSIMLQSDYTKKSQELKQLQQEKKFADNLQYDLKAVRQNPALAEQFKKIYPKHYHPAVDDLVDLLKTQDAKKEQTQEQKSPVDPKFLEEFNGMKSELQQWKDEQHRAQVETHTQKLVAIEEQMVQKYPKTDVELVYARMQALVDSGQVDPSSINQELWERLYKDVHDKFEKLTKTEQKQVFNQVKETNKKASDVGRSGGTPGQAPKRVGLSEATDVLLEDLKNGNFKL